MLLPLQLKPCRTLWLVDLVRWRFLLDFCGRSLLHLLLGTLAGVKTVPAERGGGQGGWAGLGISSLGSQSWCCAVY